MVADGQHRFSPWMQSHTATDHALTSLVVTNGKLNETYAPLRQHDFWFRHGFTLRVPGVDVTTDRENVIRHLSAWHRAILADSGVARSADLLVVEQVHGAQINTVRGGFVRPDAADGLCTNEPGVLIGIYVADCGPLWVLDPVHKAVGLAHSGRKGTNLNIAGALIRQMCESFDSKPSEMEAFLGPCIRPPHYETDFATHILEQCVAEGIGLVNDCGINTASNLDRYYSYRAENGRTGRMLAWAQIRLSPISAP